MVVKEKMHVNYFFAKKSKRVRAGNDRSFLCGLAGIALVYKDIRMNITISL